MVQNPHPSAPIQLRRRGAKIVWRSSEDIRQLIRVLDLHTADDVLASVREIFPEEEPPQRLRLLLEDIFTGKE